MEVVKELSDLYGDYYADGAVVQKRRETAIQTVGHIRALVGDSGLSGSVLDVGSGDGAVLLELSKLGLGSDYFAVEISSSGIDSILKNRISNLREAKQFDGYKIPYHDKQFDIALAVHVIEHVEHERLFIRELLRVAKRVYVEVPLEHNMKLKKAMAATSKYGHINFYTPAIFRNLLETSGARVEALEVFSLDRRYEEFIAGKGKGVLKYVARTGALRILPALATNIFAYMCGAVITRV